MALFLNRYPHKQSKEEEKLKGGEERRRKEKKRGIYKAPNQLPINFFSIQPSRKKKRETK